MNNKETCPIFAQVYYFEYLLRNQQIFIKCVRFKLCIFSKVRMQVLQCELFQALVVLLLDFTHY